VTRPRPPAQPSAPRDRPFQLALEFRDKAQLAKIKYLLEELPLLRLRFNVLGPERATLDKHTLRAPFDALIEAHIGRVHSQPHDLDAFYVGPMQTAVHILAGPGHETAVEDAGRMWGLSQVGRSEEALALKPVVNRALKRLPSQAFPAVLHLAAAGEQRGGLKRLRLVSASLRGRV
jgi:phytoene synthase